jgi:3-deoxy-7-phosphoheptulonate synthase
MDYARRLTALAQELQEKLYLVMRVFFEKPRTTVGWKGLIMDPHLDGTCDIPAGLWLARKTLLEVLDLGMPTATELLDPITPQYITDLSADDGVANASPDGLGPLHAARIQERHLWTRLP